MRVMQKALEACGDECSFRVQDYCFAPGQSGRGMTPIMPETKFENGFPRWCPLEVVDEGREKTPTWLTDELSKQLEG